MKTFVYGVFSGETCLYIGHTARLRQRIPSHNRRFPGAQFRVLRECFGDGYEQERNLIADYKAIGQARFNRVKHRKTFTRRKPGALLSAMADSRRGDQLIVDGESIVKLSCRIH